MIASLLGVDVETVRAVLAAQGVPAESVVLLGAGLDNVAFEVDGSLIVRFATDATPDDIVRQTRLLHVVAEISPLPTPRPAFAVPDQGCLAYPKLPGTPLLDLAAGAETGAAVAVAGRLGAFLAALHATPLDRFAGLVEPDEQPLDEWLSDAAELHASVVGSIPAAHHRPLETFLATAPPAGDHALVFSHSDLGIEHVLVEPESHTVTGIIDWTDAALVDPARDFALIYRDLGPSALDTALRAHGGVDATLRERAEFYARCGVLEDLAYGLETGRHRYTDKSVTALRWLFP